jgi:predicted amidohydrolase YtcJ
MKSKKPRAAGGGGVFFVVGGGARVAADTASPDGGEILRDEDGEPTGMLLGRAQPLVARHLPAPDAALDEILMLGARRSVEYGWTQLHVASGDYEEIEALRDLYQRGDMRLRIYQAVRAPSASADRLLQEGGFHGLYDGRYSVRAIKLAVDGALGSGGAALLEPYEDREGRGYLQFDADELRPYMEGALRNGLQVWAHAIGDRGNRFALDLFEEAFTGLPEGRRPVHPPRWRVEHAQLLHADDLPRFAALGVIPSMQPSHAIGDLHYAPRRVGLERLRHAYAWRDLIDSGARVAGGSDAPVEAGDPRIEFYAAVTRRDPEGFQGEGWYPEQAVSRLEALYMFTRWAAEAAFEEDLRGSIEVDKYADFTVFGADLMEIEAEAILGTPIVMTVVAGEVLFDGR